MKKAIFVFIVIMTIFMPICSYASILDETPPYVEIIGINEKDYRITKTIKNDEVVIGLEEKATGFNYSWTFNKNKIVGKITLNFNIDFESTKKDAIDRVAGDINKMYLSFSHHGDLPANTKIKVDVSSKFANGDKLYLYYYNEERKEVEFVDNNIEVKDGFVELEIDHCSEYFLTSAIVNDAVNNPKSLNYVIVTLVLIIIGLIGYTIFNRK